MLLVVGSLCLFDVGGSLSVVGCWWLLLVVCCSLFVVRCVLLVVWCRVFVSCWLVVDGCCVLAA